MAEKEYPPPNELKELFACLRGDKEDEALDLIAQMEVRTLCLYVGDEKGFLGTALLYAIKQNKMRAMAALLEKKVDIDAGQLAFDDGYELGDSPLLYAIKKKNIALLDLLLENGADPLFDSEKTKQLIVTNGKYLTVYDIPFLYALKKGAYIFNRILQYSIVSTEFGPGLGGCSEKHTCLCYAVGRYFNILPYPERFQIIQKIIAKGGKVCSGKSNYCSVKMCKVTPNGTCSEIVNFFQEMLNEELDSRSYEDAKRCLSLLCETDYMHENSTLYKSVATYTDTEDPFTPTWVTNITKHSSTLKHICRVYIRRYIPGMCIEVLKTLAS